MENTLLNDPKDEHILNKDDSVTNKDGDSYLEKGNQPVEQKKPDQERVPTVTPDNENGDPGPPAKQGKDEKDRDKEKERQIEVVQHRQHGGALLQVESVEQAERLDLIIEV